MKSFQKLIGSLKRFPGIGPKQAERMALFLLRSPQGEAENLISTIREARNLLRPCRDCLDFTEFEFCHICSDPERDKTILCIVEEPQDVVAFERARSYRGLYHVLHGAISPLDGKFPQDLKIEELLIRLRQTSPQILEVILAMDPDTEGEATTLYLTRILKDFAIKITRIAHGVPLGGDLDYLDERTLSESLMGRREVE
jgi:recombination protein RecR